MMYSIRITFGGQQMLKRKAYQDLLKWKNGTKGKALCIIGARQTGKTTLIREFGKNEYEHFAEINFVTDKKAADIFSGKLTAEEIITNMTAYLQKPLEAGKTLILFDEIQECPEIRSAIKFLVEDGRFDYIESGSLLGVRYKDIKSYSVGFEQMLSMYPLDFEEYLWANGVQEQTIFYLRECYKHKEKVSESVHETLCKLFYSYLVVGGMPQNVQIYVDTHDIAKVILNQRSILDLYRLDIARYASENKKLKIKAIFDSISAQLNEKNRRFKINSIHPDARILRYEDSFNWLADAGVALPCYNVTEPQTPLQLNEKRNLFKLYMNDVGLLCASCMENIQFDLLMGNVDINMGSILENAFAQNLKSNGFELHYFDSKKIGELDFVLQKGLSTELLEIKSGKDFKKHPAMNHAMQTEQWKFEHCIVFSKSNVEAENGILYLPWYMVMFFQQQKEPEQMIYEIDLSSLSQNS